MKLKVSSSSNYKILDILRQPTVEQTYYCTG